jgi:beta-galactosidase
MASLLLRRTSPRGFSSLARHLIISGILILCAIQSTQTLYATTPQYTPLTPEQRKIALHSANRLVYSLAGEWQRQVTSEDTEWKTVTLPFSETTTGEIHYRRTFIINQQLINNYEWHLHFLGSNYKTQVYVNGQYLQSHAGGTVPFQVRIPDQYLQNGSNTVELIVNNELDAATTIPLRRTPLEAKVFGGIYRELFLVGTSEVFFNSVETRTSFQNEETGTIQITASISTGALRNLLLMAGDTVAASVKNPAQLRTSIEVTAELRTSEDSSSVVTKAVPVTIEIQPNRNIEIKLTLPFSQLKLWSPSTPYLYSFVAHIRHAGKDIDDFVVPLGLCNVQKTIVNDKPQLLLNGKPTVFKAIDYIEDSEANRQTINMAEYEKDVITLKTLGATVVRVRYNTPHPYFSYLCDKYGIFVMIDLPLTGAPASVLEPENFVVTAQLAMREMIQCYNHNVSTLAWGLIENAQEGTPAFTTFTRRLMETIRPNSGKLLYKTVHDAASTLDIEGMDFIIFNMNRDNPQAFRMEAERLAALAKQAIPVFHFSKSINPENHNGYSDPLSVEAQAKHIRNCFRILQENKISDNVVIGVFSDYMAEQPVLNVNNADQFVVTAGLVSRNRDARVAYYMVKALFNDEKEPILETGNYQPESPTLYTILSIILLIVFFVLINSNRRFREDIARALLRPYNFYTDIRDQRILSNAGTLTLALIVSGTLGILLSSVLYFIRFDRLLDYALTHFIPSNAVKEVVNSLIWLPLASCAAGTLLFLLLLVVTTLLVRAGSLFVRSRILISDALVISVWACLPTVFLLIMTMGLYKIMTGLVYAQIAFALIIAVLIWSLYRALGGTSIIYDVRSSRIYAAGITLIVLILTVVALMYNSKYATFAYTQYFFSVLWN